VHLAPTLVEPGARFAAERSRNIVYLLWEAEMARLDPPQSEIGLADAGSDT
jgi:hypothetical protein